MFFKKKTDIHHSASVTAALELVRQILEIYIGCPLRLVGETSIYPGAVVEYTTGSARNICIHGSFIPTSLLEPPSPPPRLFTADIDLGCPEDQWMLSRARIGLKSQGEEHYGTWVWGHPNIPEPGKLQVAEDQRGQKGMPHWWIGHTFADRRQEPFYGRSEDCQCGGPDCGSHIQIWHGPREIPKAGEVYAYRFYKRGMGGSITDEATVEVAEVQEVPGINSERGYMLKGTVSWRREPRQPITITDLNPFANRPHGKVVY